ncbi:uncharacterized protein LOC143922123 [Arctopsyche grandis]|uniref:uncharacterized protein LOC143922123 n=1 Tax=Arctopsyche grandis TaxID=121162 RepID=UPI00406D7C28
MVEKNNSDWYAKRDPLSRQPTPAQPTKTSTQPLNALRQPTFFTQDPLPRQLTPAQPTKTSTQRTSSTNVLHARSAVETTNSSTTNEDQHSMHFVNQRSSRKIRCRDN